LYNLSFAYLKNNNDKEFIKTLRKFESETDIENLMFRFGKDNLLYTIDEIEKDLQHKRNKGLLIEHMTDVISLKPKQGELEIH